MNAVVELSGQLEFARADPLMLLTGITLPISFVPSLIWFTVFSPSIVWLLVTVFIVV
jgi:hypothetical protein